MLNNKTKKPTLTKKNVSKSVITSITDQI